MKNLKRAALVVALLTTAACTNTGGLFGNGDTATGPGAGGVIEQSSLAYFEQTIGDTVLFEVDQSSLTPTAMAILDAQAEWLNANLAVTITIEGHADEQGTRDYNLALGARRAASVRDYLVGKGVADNRISVVSYGKERPLAICSNESCWSKNRRAVTVVTGGMPVS